MGNIYYSRKATLKSIALINSYYIFCVLIAFTTKIYKMVKKISQHFGSQTLQNYKNAKYPAEAFSAGYFRNLFYAIFPSFSSRVMRVKIIAK